MWFEIPPSWRLFAFRLLNDNGCIIVRHYGDATDEFADCCGRWEPRGKLAKYVRGQLSELPRKSAAPMELAAGIGPRSLQEFLSTDERDQERLRFHTQRLISRDHGDEQAIGIIDESGHPKKTNAPTGCQAELR